MNKGLYDKLTEYSKNGNYGFHMPGHKRNVKLLNGIDVFDIDITEIEDFDNLHSAEGIIKESMDNAAGFWGTDGTWFLVNGSSGGILSAIDAITDIGDCIVIGRNCHKSVYNAAAIRNLEVKYVYPSYIEEYGINGGYNPADFEKIFDENKNIKAVVITSPTYDGIVSDIKSIAEIVHKNNAVLIVDEAHGAHLGISDKLPIAAYDADADVVIESVHKTLPSLTQTAMLHIKGSRVSREKIEESLAVYQSSSPSYVFMAAIDRCMRQLQTEGKKNIERLLITVNKFREKVNNLRYFKIPGKELIDEDNVFDVDLTKLVIHVDKRICDGKQLSDMLRNEYHFEMEMASPEYVLAITTICDNECEIMRLADCLEQIDLGFCNDVMLKDDDVKEGIHFELPKNKIRYSIYDAKKMETRKLLIEEAEGMISGEYLYLYPPGIPLLVPGEEISNTMINQIEEFKCRKLRINGLRDKSNKYIKVICSNT